MSGTTTTSCYINITLTLYSRKMRETETDGDREAKTDCYTAPLLLKCHAIGLMGRVIPKTQKMLLDATLLNAQHYKARIKGKVEQFRERSSALPYISV